MKVVVVGGGAAGCAAAYTLRKRGHDVELFEASDAVGGRIRTIERDGFTIETGAIYLLSLYTRTRALLEEMGRMPEVRAWSPVAGLFDGTTLHPVRYDFLPSFFKLPLLDRSDKLRLVRKGAALTLRPGPDPYETDSLASYDTGEDMETWSRRELGDHVHEYLVRPLIEPTFGVECSEIAAPYLQGALKRAYKVGFSVPKAGMSDICAALTSDVGVHLDTRVTAVDVSSTGATVRLADGSTHHADAVVVATDSVTAAAILGDSIDPQTTESLTESPYATMAHVVLRWLDDPWPDSTEEMLLPVGPGAHPVVGIIARGKDSPSPVPAGAKALSVYLSDTLTREVDDEGAVTAALESAEAMLGKAPAPDYADVYRFERALALSPPGHYATMQGVRRAVPPRLALAGDYLAHLGVESAVVSGERAAHELDAVLREHTM